MAKSSCDALILTDEPVAHDKRVQATMRRYPDAKLVECSRYVKPRWWQYVFAYTSALKMLASNWRSALKRYKQIKRHYPISMNCYIHGLLMSIQHYVCAATQHYQVLVGQSNQLRWIYANDLLCGLIACRLANEDTQIIYDAHEVSFHRNRPNCWLSVLLDLMLEDRVMTRAKTIYVVNSSIAELYHDIYGRTPIVRDNQWFSYQPPPRLPSNQQSPAIIYVGGGVAGRMLEDLDHAASGLSVERVGFFLGRDPARKIKVEQWILGDKAYLEPLRRLQQQRRCVMWCCLENVCLSYYLSWPTKFYQAIMLGMPVIVAKQHRLAQVVEHDGIGYVFNGNNLGEIIDDIQSGHYAILCQNIREFSKRWH